MDIVPEDKMEKAMEIISETCWEGDIDVAKQQRSELFDTAGIEIAGHIKATSSSGMLGSQGRKPVIVADENASYSSLVGSSGF